MTDTTEVRNCKQYFTDLLILSVPLLIGNLGHTLTGASDVFVVAKYDIKSLAAVSIANSILYTIIIYGLGLISAVSIILSNMRGAKRKTKKYLGSTLIFALILAVFFTLICFLTNYLIPCMGFNADLISLIRKYIIIVSFSMFGMFIFEGIKQFLQSFEIVNIPNFLLLSSVILNLILDILFVFGCGFIPAMGSTGAAIATLSVRTLLGLIMFVYVFKFLDFKFKTDFSYIKQLVKTGAPIGTALMLEVLAFNIITVLAGRESHILAAAHSILITISNATFMVPLSISAALSVKIAYFYGAGKTAEIKCFSFAGIVTGVGFMAIAGILMALFPKRLISIFTTDEQLLQAAVPIVFIAAMYQVFDGLQVVTGGILKGFKMTKCVSWAVFSGYWAAGMPAAIFLTGILHMSLCGYWTALAISLFVIGIIETIAACYKFNQIKNGNYC